MPDLARHRLSHQQVAALAAGISEVNVVADLLRVERSWRLVQLRAVLEALLEDEVALSGPLPPISEAWQLLVRAERQSAVAVSDLISRPQVGTWAGYFLRRMHGSVTSDIPTWVDAGYLHALAAAAAARAGLEFAIAVPAWQGNVVIPAIGTATMPASRQWDIAEIRCADGLLTVHSGQSTVAVRDQDRAAPGWTPLPRLATTAGRHTLNVALDHLDPYRGLRDPLLPDVLPPDDVDRWATTLSEAWQIVVDACPHAAAAIAEGLASIVPQPRAERFRTMSASAGDAFGSMVISEPDRAVELAVTLVHEFQHIKLGGLLHLAALHQGEPEHLLYAPWRDDPRPLSGLLQGTYAFVGITEFWRLHLHTGTASDADLAAFEYARWQEPVRQTLRMLAGLPQLTDLGRTLVAGLQRTADNWSDEDVPPEVVAAARAAAADHAVRWRLHHIQPATEVISEFCAAWTARRNVSPRHRPSYVVKPHAQATRLDVQAVLELWRLTDPAGFERLRTRSALVGQTVRGSTESDLLQVAGVHAPARLAFLERLRADARDRSAWAGLAQLERRTPAGHALLAGPEIVMAVYCELAGRSTEPAALEPLDVADFIGRSIADTPTSLQPIPA